MNRLIAIFVLLAVIPSLSSAQGLLDEIKTRSKTESNEVRINKHANKPREHYIDPYREMRIPKKSEYRSKCNIKDFKKMYDYEQCRKDAMKEYRVEYPDRGTPQYGEKFYSGLSKEEAKEKRDQLIELMDRVSFNPKPGNEKIELTINQLHIETMYIERYVLKVTPRDYRPFK